MSPPSVRLGVVIPAGPADDVLDTLQSVFAYTGSSRVVVVVDDTHGRVTNWPDRPDLAVVPAPPRSAGAMGGLWVKIAYGYRQLLGRCRPDLVLRLDADALVIGSGIEAAAMSALTDGVGMLGSYRVGSDGGRRDFSWAARQLRRERGWLGTLTRRGARDVLRHLYAAAVPNGYVDGHSPLGGAYLHSGAAAGRIDDSGWFDLPALAASKLGEDQIMALVTYAAGFRLADFGRPADPLALGWKALPAAPADLVAAGKLVTHSVRAWKAEDEAAIRRFFAERRPTG